MKSRLREEKSLGEEQIDIMSGRGTTDAVFAIVKERCREMQHETHAVFVN